MMPQVFNKAIHNAQADAVYIGRPSKWGNPFKIGRDGDRATVISKFRTYLEERQDLVAAIKRELHDKDLVCWCAPQACHGDVLLEIANEAALSHAKE